MGREPANPVVRLPGWVVVVFSVVVVFHFAAVIVGVLATRSGPWPTDEGANMIAPPQFAFDLNRTFGGPYLRLAKLNHHFHFLSNRPGLPAAEFDVQLKDAKGQEIATVHVPEADANYWVRHREGLLARWLAEDQPVMQPQSEVIAPPNQQVPTIQIWEETEPQKLKLRNVSQHLIPRDRPVVRPREMSMLVARSYVRHLCRARGAASGEVIRTHKDPIPPAAMTVSDIQAGAFQKVFSSFGEMPK